MSPCFKLYCSACKKQFTLTLTDSMFATTETAPYILTIPTQACPFCHVPFFNIRKADGCACSGWPFDMNKPPWRKGGNNDPT